MAGLAAILHRGKDKNYTVRYTTIRIFQGLLYLESRPKVSSYNYCRRITIASVSSCASALKPRSFHLVSSAHSSQSWFLIFTSSGAPGVFLLILLRERGKENGRIADIFDNVRSSSTFEQDNESEIDMLLLLRVCRTTCSRVGTAVATRWVSRDPSRAASKSRSSWRKMTSLVSCRSVRRQVMAAYFCSSTMSFMT